MRIVLQTLFALVCLTSFESAYGYEDAHLASCRSLFSQTLKLSRINPEIFPRMIVSPEDLLEDEVLHSIDHWSFKMRIFSALDYFANAGRNLTAIEINGRSEILTFLSDWSLDVDTTQYQREFKLVKRAEAENEAIGQEFDDVLFPFLGYSGALVTSAVGSAVYFSMDSWANLAQSSVFAAAAAISAYFVGKAAAEIKRLAERSLNNEVHHSQPPQLKALDTAARRFYQTALFHHGQSNVMTGLFDVGSEVSGRDFDIKASTLLILENDEIGPTRLRIFFFNLMGLPDRVVK